VLSGNPDRAETYSDAPEKAIPRDVPAPTGSADRIVHLGAWRMRSGL
jgi:hypothetical protein